jgi:hypothetical protein
LENRLPLEGCHAIRPFEFPRPDTDASWPGLNIKTFAQENSESSQIKASQAGPSECLIHSGGWETEKVMSLCSHPEKVALTFSRQINVILIPENAAGSGACPLTL